MDVLQLAHALFIMEHYGAANAEACMDPLDDQIVLYIYVYI